MDIISIIASLAFGINTATADPHLHADGYIIVLSSDYARVEWISERGNRDRECTSGGYLTEDGLTFITECWKV